MPIPYRVPGIIKVLAQPSSKVCWATVFTMIKSWKDQVSHEITEAPATVDQQYVDLFNSNSGLPPKQFGLFLSTARLQYLSPQNLTIDGWLRQLMNHGPIWVGTMNSVDPNAGLHSMIIRGIAGDGTAAGTSFEMIDPDDGKLYVESLDVFIEKYENAYNSSGDDQYIQIRFY